MIKNHLTTNLGILALMIVILAGSYQVRAQCNCDHTVPLSVEIFDGNTEGVSPGDIICVEDGTRDRLHFRNIIGTGANPITIINCGGQVVINGTGSGASNVALKLNGNKHFRVTGTGDSSYQYGFKVGGETHATVEAQGRATNFEFDHIEVFSSGFAGFMIKTDPNGSGENVRPNAPDAVNGGFTMYDVSVHDCYIHDILDNGEGIYLGNSFWQTGHPPTGGQYPHNIYGAKIYNNIIDKTGREAIQAGCVVEGLEIYNNHISNYGWNNTSNSQNNGIQIGQGSSGRVYNNYINNENNSAGSRAIYVMGIGDNYVYNNVIVGGGSPEGQNGSVIINANLKDAPLPGDPGYDTGGFIGGAYFINNTIIDTKGVAEVFGTYLNNAPNNVLYNNLVVSDNEDWDGISGSNWVKGGNLQFDTEAQVDFVDYANEDYGLESTSDAVDAGTDVSSYGINIDFPGNSRPANSTYDIGAYEYGASGGGSNNPPVLSFVGSQSLDEKDTLVVNIHATDQDNDILSLSTSNLPSFTSFVDNGDYTGTLTIAPQEGDEGTYAAVQILASDGNGGTDSETFTITVNNDDSTTAISGPPIYRVNAGGQLEPDSILDWEKDKQNDPASYFDSNSVNYTTGSNAWSGTNNTNAPDNIFGPYRYDNGASWGERQHWDFAVDNGNYEVRLYFNAVSSSSGTNVFDVEIEGIVKLDDYDVYAVAGGSNIPVEESFIVSVNDGNLDIDFPTIETGLSLIHGIEILSTELNELPVLSSLSNQTVTTGDTLVVNVSASDPDNDDITLTTSNLPAFASFIDNGDDTGTLTISPQSGDEGTYSGIVITASDGNGGEDSETFDITVELETSALYRVNAGGLLESDTELDWEKDKQNDPASYFDSNSVNYTTGSNTWSGTNNTNAPDNIFGPYRFENGASWGERQHWDFPVSNGTYEVRLYFRAISSSSGTNVFDVEIEGSVVLDDYDVYATTGGNNIPVEESFTATVSDGNLDIDFPVIEAGNSFIHGIEIRAISSSQRVAANESERSQLKENLNAQNIVYPNPVEDRLYVKVQGLEGQRANIYLLDMSGKVLKTSQMKIKDGLGSKEINIGRMNISSGVYLLKIESDNFHKVTKLIKN